MPIIELVDADAPLTQGDILTGIRLFATADGWLSEGGEAVKAGDKLCLVLSRPCVALHKERIVVAMISPYKGNVPTDVKSFDQLLAFLSATRDGTDSPDVFYLGEIPSQAGRHAARLDSLHTIQVPSDVAARASFLRERRIGRLSPDFARDLHLRLLRTFASLGFDDVAWLSDNDLEWVLKKGRSELAAAEVQLHEKDAASSQKSFEGGQFPASQVVDAQGKVDELKARLAPFEAEAERRSKAGPS